MREKLIELLSENFVDFCNVDIIAGHAKIRAITFRADEFADYLLAHGVTLAPDNNVGDKKPMSNGDRIRAMADEELAAEFAAMASYCAPGNRPSPYNCSLLGCINCWINWLKQPAKEEKYVGIAD